MQHLLGVLTRGVTDFCAASASRSKIMMPPAFSPGALAAVARLQLPRTAVGHELQGNAGGQSRGGSEVPITPSRRSPQCTRLCTG